MRIEKYSDLVGNTMIVSLIRKGVFTKSLPNYILFSGVYGVGKSSLAELLAMAMTCESPNKGEACGVCNMCKKNKLALAPGGSGVSSRIEKVNMALVKENNSIKDLLRETFQLVRTEGVYVKIFEEFDKLGSNQELFLEETARTPENMYIILTTTHIENVLKEIESRCLQFTFGRLNRGETTMLIDKVNRNLKLRREDYDMIFQKTGGIPRNIVLLVEFLSVNNPTPEEIDALLGNINSNILFDLFNQIPYFRLFMEAGTGLMRSYTIDLILSKLSEFLVQLIFAIEGEIYDVYSKKAIRSFPIRQTEQLYKILKIVESTPPTEQGMILLLMKIRRLIIPPMTVSEQKLNAEMAQQIQRVEVKTEETPLTRFKG